MTAALAIAIPLVVCVVFALGVYIGHQAAGGQIQHLREQRDDWKTEADDAINHLDALLGLDGSGEVTR